MTDRSKGRSSERSTARKPAASGKRRTATERSAKPSRNDSDSDEERRKRPAARPQRSGERSAGARPARPSGPRSGERSEAPPPARASEARSSERPASDRDSSERREGAVKPNTRGSKAAGARTGRGREEAPKVSKRAGRRPPGDVRRGEAPQIKNLDFGSKPMRKPGSKSPWTKERSERPEHRPSAGGEWREKKSRMKNPQAPLDGLMRLNRYLAQSGICSRREADDLITAGVVTVNGVVVTELGAKVYPTDKVHYGGQRLSMEKKRYVLLNKPKDFITTTDDPRDRRTVMNLVATACTERIYPVGRLDRQTTGVLLMTNDGDLSKKLTHPSHGAEKIYHVTLDKSVTKAHLKELVEGLELEDGTAQADEANYVDGASKREVGIKIHMGRNRIVRRMFEHLGYEVLKLDRVVFAGLTKKDVPRGTWRHLTEKELLFLTKRK